MTDNGLRPWRLERGIVLFKTADDGQAGILIRGHDPSWVNWAACGKEKPSETESKLQYQLEVKAVSETFRGVLQVALSQACRAFFPCWTDWELCQVTLQCYTWANASLAKLRQH